MMLLKLLFRWSEWERPEAVKHSPLGYDRGKGCNCLNFKFKREALTLLLVFRIWLGLAGYCGI